MYKVRIDDFPFITERYDTGEILDRIETVCAAFNSFRVPFILGVIPAYLSANMGEKLRRLLLPYGRAVLHGWDHALAKIPSGDLFEEFKRKGGEFAGQGYAEIEHNLGRGRDVLCDFVGREAVDLTEYIAPFNAYTQPLLDALNMYGVNRLHTCDLEFDAYGYKDLEYAHVTPVVAKLHHGYDFVSEVRKCLNDPQCCHPVTLHWVYDIRRPHWVENYRSLAQEISEL